MTKSIKSYDDLLQERQRLELLLESQKQIIQYDVQQIKEELKPVRKVFGFLKMIMTQDKSSFLFNIGSDIAINSIVRRFILSKTGWITKLVVPFFMKNFSSHVFAGQKEKWFEKLKTWLAHRNGKKQHEEKAAGED